MRITKSILIKTQDKRNLFADPEMLPLLGEYVRTFKAKVFTVKSPEAKQLKIRKLAKAICDANYHDAAEFEVIKEITFEK